MPALKVPWPEAPEKPESCSNRPLEACRRAEVVIRYLRWSSKVGLKYDMAPNPFSKWEELTWTGSLVSWCGGCQPFAAASTAEAELLSLTDAFMLARAMEPLIGAFHKFKGQQTLCE